MDTPKRQITARIPEAVYLGAAKKADEKGVTFTEILIDALEMYLGSNIPGLCPKCHTQNDLDADYCKKCRQPLSDKAKEDMRKTEELIQSSPECMAIFQEFLHKMEQKKRDNS